MSFLLAKFSLGWTSFMGMEGSESVPISKMNICCLQWSIETNVMDPFLAIAVSESYSSQISNYEPKYLLLCKLLWTYDMKIFTIKLELTLGGAIIVFRKYESNNLC